MRMPFDLPSRTVNSLTAKIFNRLYFERIPKLGRERHLDLERFFYPLDSILDWNRLYGRAGFVQFQCVIPDAAARDALRTLLTRIAATGNASFLAVIKTLGSNGRGHLSFPMRGITLALDFPQRDGVVSLLDTLHDITIDYGGRVYLAKDSCLKPAQFRRMYPRLPELQAVLGTIDPQRHMRSDMAVRLQV
jgi:decaprenylphospho-beta-D-ribofuranose 2-oxidase